VFNFSLVSPIRDVTSCSSNPHRSEYADDGRGDALEPLRDKDVNDVVLDCLPRLLEKAAQRVPGGLLPGVSASLLPTLCSTKRA
jgi:hypothetical protein